MNALAQELMDLQLSHLELDTYIKDLEQDDNIDESAIKQLKLKKLKIKDQIEHMKREHEL